MNKIPLTGKRADDELIRATERLCAAYRQYRSRILRRVLLCYAVILPLLAALFAVGYVYSAPG